MWIEAQLNFVRHYFWLLVVRLKTMGKRSTNKSKPTWNRWPFDFVGNSFVLWPLNRVPNMQNNIKINTNALVALMSAHTVLFESKRERKRTKCWATQQLNSSQQHWSTRKQQTQQIYIAWHTQNKNWKWAWSQPELNWTFVNLYRIRIQIQIYSLWLPLTILIRIGCARTKICLVIIYNKIKEIHWNK